MEGHPSHGYDVMLFTWDTIAHIGSGIDMCPQIFFGHHLCVVRWWFQISLPLPGGEVDLSA